MAAVAARAYVRGDVLELSAADVVLDSQVLMRDYDGEPFLIEKILKSDVKGYKSHGPQHCTVISRLFMATLSLRSPLCRRPNTQSFPSLSQGLASGSVGGTMLQRPSRRRHATSGR